MLKYASLSTAIILASTLSAHANTLEVKRVASKDSPRLQAISINPNGDIWASGIKGQVVVSSDEGKTWHNKTVPDAQKLQFRDIWSRGSTTYLLAAGDGDNSRLYKSEDNGNTWTNQYTMAHPKGFINCFDFWDENNGIVIGDTIDQQVFMLATTDGGHHWSRVTGAPLANTGGEGGFSASGSCARIDGETAWLTTGATSNARILRTEDRGITWSSTPLPFPNSKTGGIFSAIPKSGYAFGGQMKPAIVTGYHRSNGHWHKIKGIPLTGAIYGSDSYGENIIVVNPDGAALSKNGGKSWMRISSDSYWVVEIDSTGVAWLAGPQGQVSSIDLSS